MLYLLFNKTWDDDHTNFRVELVCATLDYDVRDRATYLFADNDPDLIFITTELDKIVELPIVYF